MLKKVLVKVSQENTNREVRMVQTGDTRFEVITSRVGATPVRKPYPLKYWDTIYNKHIADGFTDITVYAGNNNVRSDYVGLSDRVTNFIERLRKDAETTYKPVQTWMAQTSVKTESMVEKARELLRTLSENTPLQQFNEVLLDILRYCPMEMQDVKEYLAETEQDKGAIIEFQSNRLDALEVEIKAGKGKENILDTLGLSCRPMTDEEIYQTKEHMTDSKQSFVRGWRCTNFETEKEFNDFVRKTDAKTYFYFHGSGNENIFSIWVKGLRLKIDGVRKTGSMFGKGIYFAKRAKKSLGYTSVRWKHAPGVSSERDSHDGHAYLLVYKVAYKNALHVQEYHVWMHNAEESRFMKGHDALYAHKGTCLRNDEIIVYTQQQATLYAIIEVE